MPLRDSVSKVELSAVLVPHNHSQATQPRITKLSTSSLCTPRLDNPPVSEHTSLPTIHLLKRHNMHICLPRTSEVLTTVSLASQANQQETTRTSKRQQEPTDRAINRPTYMLVRQNCHKPGHKMSDCNPPGGGKDKRRMNKSARVDLGVKMDRTKSAAAPSAADVCFKCRRHGHKATDCPDVSRVPPYGLNTSPHTDHVSPTPSCVEWRLTQIFSHSTTTQQAAGADAPVGKEQLAPPQLSTSTSASAQTYPDGWRTAWRQMQAGSKVGHGHGSVVPHGLSTSPHSHANHVLLAPTS